MEPIRVAWHESGRSFALLPAASSLPNPDSPLPTIDTNSRNESALAPSEAETKVLRLLGEDLSKARQQLGDGLRKRGEREGWFTTSEFHTLLLEHLEAFDVVD